jgi:DNA-binding response OmpR family regulator
MDWTQERVLIADRGDSPAADSAHCVLSAQGAQLDLVGDLADALALLLHGGQDYTALVFRAAGYEPHELGPLRAIRRLHPETAIIVFADAAGRERALLALTLGADALLPEPFYRSELVTLIERAVERIRGRPRERAEAAPPAESASAGEDERLIGAGVAEAAEREDTEAASATGAPAIPAPAESETATKPPEVEPAPAETEQVFPESGAPDEASVSQDRSTPETGEEPAAIAAAPAPSESPAPADAPPEAQTTDEREVEAETVPVGRETRAAAEALAEPNHLGRVLLVDNERLFRELLADVLRERGYYVADAADEKQALWRLADGDFDAIVMEARLNGHGAEGVRSFRAACPETPLIVVTSLASRTDESALREAGASLCLGKPFDVSDLVNALRTVMRFHPPTHALLTAEEVNALLAPGGADDE